MMNTEAKKNTHMLMFSQIGGQEFYWNFWRRDLKNPLFQARLYTKCKKVKKLCGQLFAVREIPTRCHYEVCFEQLMK